MPKRAKLNTEPTARTAQQIPPMIALRITGILRQLSRHPLLRNRARAGRTWRMICKPAVTDVENLRDTGNVSGGEEWPGPPDLFCEVYDGFGAAMDFPCRRNDAHFLKQLIGRQSEKGSHARVLQRGQAKTAFLERAAEASCQQSADRAIAVEANPSALGVSAFRVSHFCSKRNHNSSKKAASRLISSLPGSK
jgi:hypothetical protein